MSADSTTPAAPQTLPQRRLRDCASAAHADGGGEGHAERGAAPTDRGGTRLPRWRTPLLRAIVLPAMSRGLPEGFVVVHPNRGKPVVRGTRAAVVLLLLVSAALVLIVSVGGASAQGGLLAPIQYLFALVYLLIAYFASRWRRGVLPVASGLAVLLAIFALVGGESWFEREHSYFPPMTLNADLLGILTFAIIPVQILLIVFAMRGFNQGWNVEQERPVARRPSPIGGAAA